MIIIIIIITYKFGTHQLLIYADYVNIMGENTKLIK